MNYLSRQLIITTTWSRQKDIATNIIQVDLANKTHSRIPQEILIMWLSLLIATSTIIRLVKEVVEKSTTVTGIPKPGAGLMNSEQRRVSDRCVAAIRDSRCSKSTPSTAKISLFAVSLEWQELRQVCHLLPVEAYHRRPEHRESLRIYVITVQATLQQTDKLANSHWGN
ncbi:hypothetical protein J6590_080428 [Homalodisca vitripennis]|nr:hypothetical protein J6590_080428 [Homalodisca vitripennis]